MRQANREDVVQAALLVERWCAGCKLCKGCPFDNNGYCMLDVPDSWGLEDFLRTRGQEANHE